MYAPLLGVLDFLIGITLAFHFLGLLKEFHPRQTDLQKNTLAFSFVFTYFMNLVLLVAAYAIVSAEYALFLDFLKNAVARTPGVYEIALTAVQGLTAGYEGGTIGDLLNAIR